MFCAERRREKQEIKERIRRQRSLPEGHLAADDAKERPKTFKESLLAVTNTKNFEILRDGLTKLRNSSGGGHRDEAVPEAGAEAAAAEADSVEAGASSSLKVRYFRRATTYGFPFECSSPPLCWNEEEPNHCLFSEYCILPKGKPS